MIWELSKWKERVAFVTEDKKYYYADLIRDAISFSCLIRKRTLIFIMTSNTYESVMGYIASLNSRIVPLLLDSQIDASLFLTLYSTYRPEYVWKPIGCMSSFFEHSDRIITIDGYELVNTDSGVVDYDLNDNLALLISTSGSTGSPKLIRQSYDNILSNTVSIVEYLEITEEDIAINTLPMNYVYGLSVLNTHLYVGARIILTNQSPYSGAFWKIFDNNEVTSFAGVPYMYEMLDRLKFCQKDGRHPTLKVMTQAGGKLLPELQEKYAEYAKRNNVRFYVMYGASEATARMGYLPYKDSIRKKGSMGVAIPGGAFELMDENSRIIYDDYVTGELVYKGDNVSLGYAECLEDLSRQDDNKGVLYTGDIAYRDEEGYFYIVGRKKRFIKVHGNRIGLDETERILKNHFGVIDLACVGKDDLLTICVACDINRDELLDYVSNVLHINKKEIKTVMLDDIPKGRAGKILYHDLQKYVD